MKLFAVIPVLVIIAFIIPVAALIQPSGTILASSSFQTISGTLTGNPDMSLSVATARMRAVTINPLSVFTIREDFVISGPTPTIAVDVDGVTRMGMTLWANVQDACNQYFITWRADSTQPQGTSVVEARLVYNPGSTILSQCPGTGFSFLTDNITGTNARKVLSVNIMDGTQHSLMATRTPGTAGFQVYTDGNLAFTAIDRANTLGDNGILGARTDNVLVNFFYSVSYQSTVNLVYQTLLPVGIASTVFVAGLTMLAVTRRRGRG